MLDTFYTDVDAWLELADIYASCQQYVLSSPSSRGMPEGPGLRSRLPREGTRTRSSRSRTRSCSLPKTPPTSSNTPRRRTSRRTSRSRSRRSSTRST